MQQAERKPVRKGAPKYAALKSDCSCVQQDEDSSWSSSFGWLAALIKTARTKARVYSCGARQDLFMTEVAASSFGLQTLSGQSLRSLAEAAARRPVQSWSNRALA